MLTSGILEHVEYPEGSWEYDAYMEYAARAEGHDSMADSERAASSEPERSNPQEGQTNQPRQPDSYAAEYELQQQQLSGQHLHEEQLCEHHNDDNTNHIADKKCHTIDGSIPPEILSMLLAAEQAVQNYTDDFERANPKGTRTPYPYRTQNAGSKTAARLKKWLLLLDEGMILTDYRVTLIHFLDLSISKLNGYYAATGTTNIAALYRKYQSQHNIVAQPNSNCCAFNIVSTCRCLAALSHRLSQWDTTRIHVQKLSRIMIIAEVSKSWNSAAQRIIEKAKDDAKTAFNICRPYTCITEIEAPDHWISMSVFVEIGDVNVYHRCANMPVNWCQCIGGNAPEKMTEAEMHQAMFEARKPSDACCQQQYGVCPPLIATPVIPGKEDETTASEANDLESHPGPHCSMCGKHVDVNQIQHVYNMASVLHCSEKCHETANVIRHTALNNHEFYVSSRDLQADSAKLSISATPGTVAANPQLRAICIGALLPVKRNFAALSRTLLTTLCGLTIKDLKSNNVEIKESISRQIHQASFYNATNRLVHEVMTIHGEMAVAVIKLHIADPKQASLHHDMIILKKERQAKLNGLNLKGELPTDLPTHTRWDHWIHIPVEGELAQLIGSQQSSLTSTASQGKLMQLPSEILMRIMGFQVCAKEHAQFILKQAQDNWERFDVNPVAHNIRQWILKQLDIHISMKHRKLYIHLLDSTRAVINCLCGHYGTNLVHELRDRIAHAQSSCCEEKLNIAMTWLSALHYRIRALSVSQSHAQDITKQQYLSLVCRSLRYLVTAKRGPQYLLKVSNAYALCRPDMRVSALTAASHYMNRWEGDGDYALYSKVAVIASWEGGGLKHGSGMASETHMLWCSVQSDTVSPCILSMGIAPAMLTAEQMYAHMYQARGEPLLLYPGNQQLFEPVVQPIATDHVPGPQDNTMSSEAQDIEHQPGPQGGMNVIFASGLNCTGGDAVGAFNTFVAWLHSSDTVNKYWGGTCSKSRWLQRHLNITPLEGAQYTVSELQIRAVTTARAAICVCKSCYIHVDIEDCHLNVRMSKTPWNNQPDVPSLPMVGEPQEKAV